MSIEATKQYDTIVHGGKPYIDHQAAWECWDENARLRSKVEELSETLRRQSQKLRAAEELVRLFDILPFTNDNEGRFVCLPKESWKDLLYGPKGIENYRKAGGGE